MLVPLESFPNDGRRSVPCMTNEMILIMLGTLQGSDVVVTEVPAQVAQIAALATMSVPAPNNAQADAMFAIVVPARIHSLEAGDVLQNDIDLACG